MDYETSVNKISFQTLLTMRLVLINLFWVMRCFSASFPELTTRWSCRSAVRNSPPPLPRDLDKYPPLPPQYCCCWYCSLDTATFTSHWGSQSHLFIVPFKDAGIYEATRQKKKTDGTLLSPILWYFFSMIIFTGSSSWKVMKQKPRRLFVLVSIGSSMDSTWLFYSTDMASRGFKKNNIRTFVS